MKRIADDDERPEKSRIKVFNGDLEEYLNAAARHNR